jgi:hypothetical protein
MALNLRSPYARALYEALHSKNAVTPAPVRPSRQAPVGADGADEAPPTPPPGRAEPERPANHAGRQVGVRQIYAAAATTGARAHGRALCPVIPLGPPATLDDVAAYFEAGGIVGESQTACAMTLAALSRASFGIEGPSGSGKTLLADRLVRILPDVYTVGLSSPMALFQDAAAINGSKYLYIPELQKAMSQPHAPIVEAIKDLTEGKEATRLVACPHGGVQRTAIAKGVSVIYTLATENGYKKDAESSRRFLVFSTDASRDHVAAVHAAAARRRARTSDEDTADLERKVRNHVARSLALDANIFDPFASCLADLVPPTQKSAAYLAHYFALVDGAVKFHAHARPIISAGRQRYVLAALADHMAVHALYFDTFVHSLEDLASGSEKLLCARPRDPEWGAWPARAAECLEREGAPTAVRDAYANTPALMEVPYVT